MIRLTTVLLVGAVLGYLAFSQGKPAVEALTLREIQMLLIKTNEFDGRRVTVNGTVIHSAAVIGLGGYRLKQGDAEIFILTSRGVPAPGTQVTVSGTFRQALAVGGLNYAVIIEK